MVRYISELTSRAGVGWGERKLRQEDLRCKRVPKPACSYQKTFDKSYYSSFVLKQQCNALYSSRVI